MRLTNIGPIEVLYSISRFLSAAAGTEEFAASNLGGPTYLQNAPQKSYAGKWQGSSVSMLTYNTNQAVGETIAS